MPSNHLAMATKPSTLLSPVYVKPIICVFNKCAYTYLNIRNCLETLLRLSNLELDL